MSTKVKICTRRINRADPIPTTIRDLESDINLHLEHGWVIHGYMNTIMVGTVDGYITQMLVKNTQE
jgi:hypothetical protein